jgi:hypothetical protein
MISRRPPSLDPHFLRTARRLRVLELMSDHGSLDGFDDMDMELVPGHPEGRSQTHFLDFYSEDGLRLGMKAYGIDERLRSLGLGDYQLKVSREDAFHHRLEVFLGAGRDLEHRLMDLRVHLRHVRFKDDQLALEGDGERESFPVLVIEWLCMQNPRGSYTPHRPRLPGQSGPSTGLGRAMHNILILMAQRTRREGLLNVPEHFHLATLYQRAGYRYPSLEKEHELKAALHATKDLPFAAAAWAAHRGFLFEDTPAGRVPWRYEPVEMLLPLTPRLKRRLPGIIDRLNDTLHGPREPRLVVDTEALRESLAKEPIEGLEDLKR